MRQSLIVRTSRATALGALKPNEKFDQAPRGHVERVLAIGKNNVQTKT